MCAPANWIITILLFQNWIMTLSGETVLLKPKLNTKTHKIFKGQELSLHCELKPNTREVIWKRNGVTVVSVKRHSVGSCDWEAPLYEDIIWIECHRTSVDLTIQEVREIGVWTCSDALANTSDPVKIAFKYEKRGLKPSLSVDRRTLIPGNDLELECKVNRKVKRIIWYRNGVSVADIHRLADTSCRVVWHKESRFVTTCEGVSARLTVRDVTQTDGHSWYCYDSTHHVKSNRVYVSVLTATDQPVLVTSQEVAYLGSRINLTCVLPYKSPLVRWTADDLQFGDATVQFTGGCKFEIAEIVPENFNYTCEERTMSVAFTALQKQNMTRWRCRDPYRKLISPEAEVRVKLPSVWPTDVEINGFQGSTVDQNGMILTCTSYCDHHFVFKWHFGNMTAVVERSTYDSTTYQCSQTLFMLPDWSYNGRSVRCQVVNPKTKKTRQTRVHLDVQYPPIPRVSLELTVGGDRHPVLVCRVDANPPDVTFDPWKHMFNGELIREVEGNQTDMEYRLELPWPSYRDEGVYVCSVSNSVLQQTEREPIPKDISFQPEGAPEFITTDVITVENFNSSATLTETVISQSEIDGVTWIFNDDILTLPAEGYEDQTEKYERNVTMYTVNITRDVFDITLVIREVNEATAGEYTLEICNILGCTVTQSVLIEIVPPEESEKVEEVETVEVSSLALGEILSFAIGLAALISVILIVIVIIKRRRGQSSET